MKQSLLKLKKGRVTELGAICPSLNTLFGMKRVNDTVPRTHCFKRNSPIVSHETILSFQLKQYDCFLSETKGVSLTVLF